MTFADPRWLWGLVALPLLALLEWWAAWRVGRALKRLVGDRRPHALLDQRRASSRRLSAMLRIGALGCLVIGAARPEWGREVVRRGASGSDIVFLVDVSASMDARDVAPSRLSEARREALGVLDRLGGSRVGVVAFAGDAIRLCPLTLDRAAARLTVESLSSATISTPGTDLGRGLRAALKVLPGGRREEQAVVLWTDGEDLEQGARGAMDEVARSGVRVFAVGVGTRAGDVIPVLDAEGRATDIKRDANGNQVRSRLDEALLRSVARRTHGAYFSAGRPGGELPRLMSAIATLASAGRGERLIERPKSRFGWCAMLAMLLLALDRARARRRRLASATDTPVHSERAAAAAAALLMMFAAAPDARAQSDWAKGDHAYQAGRFADAESLYARRLKHGERSALRFNRATARALKGEMDDAEKDLGAVALAPGAEGNAAGYNLGTLLGTQKRYDPALDALRRVLERNPKDEDARWNYEVLLRHKESEQQKKQPTPPKPQPQPSSGGGNQGQSGGTPPPQPQPQSSGGPPPPQAGANPPPTSAPGGSRMSKTEAEQLLDALHELSRAELQRQRKVRVTRERQGRDW